MRQIKFIILGVIMATFMSALLGCSAIDNKAVKPIEENLKEKYGKDFTVSALGDRIGRDTATAYVYAEDDPTMRFVVRVSKEGEIVFENYAYRSVCRKAEKTVNAVFGEHSLSTECHTDFSSCSFDVPLGISVSDYIAESGADTVQSAIILKDDESITGKSLCEIFTEIYSQMPEITVGFNLFIVSEKDYDDISDEIKTETNYFDLSRLKVHGVQDKVKELYAEISNDLLSVTEDEINDILTKEAAK